MNNEVIIKARRDKGLTQVEMAKLLGLTPQHLNACEKGRATMGLKSLRKFSEVTGVPLKKLV